MKNRPIEKPLLLLLLALVLAGAFAATTPLRAQGTEQPLTIAVLPRFSELETKAQFSALIGELRKATGRRIVFRQAANFEAHLKMVRNGDVDFSYQNPMIFAQAGDSVQLLATAVIEGSENFHGIVVVKQDSPIKAVSDLRRKTIAVIDKTSAGGYISQFLGALEEGVNLADEAKIVVAPGNKVDWVIKSVADGTAEAGCIRSQDFTRVAAQLGDQSALRILFKGQDLPQWAFAARKDISPELAKTVSEALTRLPTGHPALGYSKIDRFVKGSSDQYIPLRQIEVE